MEKWTSIIVVAVVLIVIGGLGLLLSPKPAVNKQLSQASLEPEDKSSKTPQIETQSISSIEPLNQIITATIETTQGNIEVRLDGARAPLTVGNFVALARSGFYDNTSWHRIIPDFMIQGGDPLSRDPLKKDFVGTGGPGYAFADEINDAKLVRGSLAMANSGPNTNGSQFFIVTAPATPWLDGKHTNFGEVVRGMEIAEAISGVRRDDRDSPLTPQMIKKITIHDAAASAAPDSAVSMSPRVSRSPARISPQVPSSTLEPLVSPRVRQWPSPIMPTVSVEVIGADDDF